MKTTAELSQFRSNPVFWIMWALPVAAVVAGLSTLAIALRGGDVALPAAYHWEGERLDADFARARAAAVAGVEIEFAAWSASATCSVILKHAPLNPAALYLQLTHGSNASLDRMLRLQRVEAGRYESDCQPIPAGRWRISVEDDAHAWGVRGVADGPIERFTLRARDPGGAPG